MQWFNNAKATVLSGASHGTLSPRIFRRSGPNGFRNLQEGQAIKFSASKGSNGLQEESFQII